MVRFLVLTYMSIHAIVSARIVDGALSPVRRDLETGAPERCVVACQNVQRALSGPWVSTVEENRYRTIKAIIDLFIDGEVMAVRMPPSRSVRAQLALLAPPENAVWEFRTRPEKKKGPGDLEYGCSGCSLPRISL